MRSLKTGAQTMPQAAYSKWNNLRIAFALKPTRIDGTVDDRTDNSTWAAVGHAEARSRAVVPQSATNDCFQSVPMPRGASRLIRRRILSFSVSRHENVERSHNATISSNT